MKKWQLALDRGLAYASAGLVVFMMLLGTADVLCRHLWNAPIDAAYDLLKFAMGGVAFFGLAYVQHERGHITVSFIHERLSKKASAVLDLIFLFAALVVIALVAWYGGKNALSAWRAGDTTMGMVELPMGPAKMVVPIGGALLCLRLLSQIWEALAGLRGIKNENGGRS